MISTIGTSRPDVHVYNSMYPSASTPVKAQTAAILHTESPEICMQFMNCRQQHFHTIPTFCAILLPMHTTKLSIHALVYSYALNEQGTQLCSLHSLPHKDNPYFPCSAAMKFTT